MLVHYRSDARHLALAPDHAIQGVGVCILECAVCGLGFELWGVGFGVKRLRCGGQGGYGTVVMRDISLSRPATPITTSMSATCIAQKVFINTFCRSQLPYKSVNLSIVERMSSRICVGIDFCKPTLRTLCAR